MKGLGGDGYEIVSVSDEGGGAAKAAVSFGIFVASIALVLIGIALWQVSFYLGLGAAAIGAGVGARHLCIGVADLIRARGMARAAVIAAEGEALANMAHAKAKMIEAREVHLLRDRNGT